MQQPYAIQPEQLILQQAIVKPVNPVSVQMHGVYYTSLILLFGAHAIETLIGIEDTALTSKRHATRQRNRWIHDTAG
jgi:hypothetical protein